MILGNVPPQHLAFPRDLVSWRAWQESTHPVRRARTRVTALLNSGGDAPAAPLTLTWCGTRPAALLVLDATTPTQLASVLTPLRGLDGVDLAVLSTCEAPEVQRLLVAQGEDPAAWRTAVVGTELADGTGLADGTDGQGGTGTGEHLPAPLAALRVVLATGHYLPAGAAAQRWARAADVPFVVVQHGLLTPFAPPLPENALLLAFSAADAAFHAWGRPDVTSRVVGSQLLWEASRPERRAPRRAARARPVFLGQLHGAELPRTDFARAARQFCEVTGAEYRPHPSEKDAISRAQHALWRSRHLTVTDGDAALGTLDAPVASVFSTGVLEAAARGLPARVTHPAPPRWLEAFWERYGMARWDGTAAGAGPRSDVAPGTPAPWVPEREPALAVADAVWDVLGRGSAGEGTS